MRLPWLLSSLLRLFFPLLIFHSLRSLSPESNSCILLLFSISILSRSLLMQSSHHMLGLPRLLVPTPSGHLHSLPNLSPKANILSTCRAHCNLLITSVFLKLSLTPTSTLSSSIPLIRSLHSHDSSYPVVFANLLIKCP